MTTTLTKKAAERAQAAIAEMRAEALKQSPDGPRQTPSKAAAKQAKPAQPTKAVFLNFRRGRHTQRTNQFLLELPGVESRAQATKLAGRRVVWTTPGGKQLSGHITGAHGNNGVVRARFTKGLPTQAIGTTADVY